MNYCTHCRAPRAVGRFCGSCSEPYQDALLPVPVPLEGETEEEAGEEHEDHAAVSSDSSMLILLVIAVVLAVIYFSNSSKSAIIPSSSAYLAGEQIGDTFTKSGTEVTATSADKVCVQTIDRSAAQAAKIAAVNQEAGCRATIKRYLDAKG